MKKVAILTMQRTENYGAVLQAYALQQILHKLDIRSELLDLLRPQHKGYKHTLRNAQLSPYNNRMQKILKTSPGLKFKSAIFKYLNKLFSVSKKKRFYQFDQKYLQYSERSFRCSDELYSTKLDYDGYITGSDQVWNPTFPYNPEPYFLTFVENGKPKIAYAPSFGIDNLQDAVHNHYKSWLQGITHLSVRERQGAEIVYKLSGRNAKVVLDPTFLLTEDDWDTIAKKPSTKNSYIFCYSLGNAPGIESLCRHLSNITGFKIYKVGPINDFIRDRRMQIKSILNVGPSEFLGYIMNAKIIVTNSFHGTILSINMEKSFFTVPTVVHGLPSRNSRFKDILDRLSLSDRLRGSDDRLPSAEEIDLDYDNVRMKLQSEKKESIRYIQSFISCI